MGRWSGLAPAYDAHMARRGLSLADHAWVDSQPLGVAMFPTGTRRSLAHWLTFARSWGRPREGTVEPGLRTADRGLAVSEESTISGREQFADTEWTAITALGLLEREAAMLDKATTTYVSARVAAELTVAAELAEPEPLNLTDLHDMYGLAVLEEPLILADLHPTTGRLHPELRMPVRAIGWSLTDGIDHGPADDRRVGPGVMLWLYTTPDDYAAIYGESLYKLTGERIGPMALPHKREDLIIVDVCPWAFGVNWGIRDGADHIDATVPASVAFARRWFLTLMRFCWQTLLVQEPGQLSRKAAARWEKPARSRPSNKLTVLRLRRLIGSSGNALGSGEPLDRRVNVKGHWRRQYFPSLGPARLDGAWNPASHRLIWIDEHDRGPGEDPATNRHATVVVR